MRFSFSAEFSSHSYQSVFHSLVKEAGGKPRFEGKKVVTEYEGTTEDEVFKKLIVLFEGEPRHTVTIYTT